MNILLDMDGVLADFRSAALRANFMHSDDFPEEWDFHKASGHTDDTFYANIAADVRFWNDLQPYPWLKQLVSVVKRFDHQFCITTNPSRDPQCIIGKRDWLNRHFGEAFSRVMFGPQKHLMARSGAVLIDDYDRNIESFRRAGGWAITFPQPWNAAREALPCDRALFVESMLEQLMTLEDAP